MAPTPAPGSWSVAATVRASRALCETFARHQLARGASRVFLFHDDPEMACDLALPGVTSTICDDSWWRRGRPEALEQRQVHNATRAKGWCGTEWILHCDIDELIWAESDIGEVLASVPPDVGGILVRPVEAVYAAPPDEGTIFHTPHFKRFFSPAGRPRAYRDISQRVYGALWEATKYGFWGHILGKSFIRAAAPVGKMPLHGKKPDEIAGLKMRHHDDRLVLRHYDTLSLGQWKDKHLRRITGKVLVPQAGKFRARQQQLIAETLAREGEDGLDRLYLRMAVMPPELLAESLEAGFVRLIPPEPHLAAPPAMPATQ